MLDLPGNQRLRIELEKRFQVRHRAARLGLLAILIGCAPVALPDGERRVALRETAEAVISPTHAELSARTQRLYELSSELEAVPLASTLTALRQALGAARAPLKEAEAFGFGPAVELHSSAALDQAPIDTDKLEAELAGAAELSREHVGSLGANKRGLHAIEYLIFPDDDAVAAELLADSEAGKRRRQFLRAAAELVAAHALTLEAAWDPAQGGYLTRFAQPGAPESVTKTVQSALDTLLNEAVFLSEHVADNKLGKPLGVNTGGPAEPALQESRLSGLSTADMLGNLRGIRNVYLGSRDGSVGRSLSSLVHAKSPAADARTRQALADAEQSLLDLPAPFTTALTEQPESVQAAYDSVKGLKRVLATEVLGILGASLKFNDNDGD